MSDTEIIKALDFCCGNNGFSNECSKSVCYQCDMPEERSGDTRWCRQWLIKDALDLINRQKAEIERYKGVIKILENDVMNAKSEVMKELAEREDYT